MADYSASNQLKLSELNAHRVGNDLPAITMKELISRESNGIRVDVGLPDESFDGLTFNPKFVIDRPSNKSVSQKLKSNQANMNALFDIRQDELAYVQDREFGTYENNLTEQTVNAEAEKIFAEQNQIRDALNTELVQKHNDSLKPTYSPGDKVSAAQMQNKTYGLGVNPGEETSFIDQTSDKYGRSEQNIENKAKAFEKAKLEGKSNADELTSEMANDTLKAEIKASNDNERQVNEMFDAAALKALETQNSLDFAAKESAAAEQLFQDEKDTIGNKRFGAANSGNVSDADAKIFKEAKKQRAYDASVQELAASDRDGLGKLKEVSTAQGTHHDTGKSEVVKQKVEDEFKLVNQGLSDIKAEASLKRIAAAKEKAQKDAEWEDYKLRSQDRTRENFEKTLEGQGESYLNNDLTDEDGNNIPYPEVKGIGTSVGEQSSNAAEQAKIKGLKEQEALRLKSNADTTSLGEGVDTREKLKRERIQKESADQREQDIQDRVQDLSAEQREQDIKDRTRLLEEERAQKTQFNNADANNIAGESGFYNKQKGTNGVNRAQFRKLKADKLASEIRVADRIGSKMSRDNDRSKDPQRLMAGDPYAFSTLSYPSDVTNNGENGHYVLFYVNVQNKTKYNYEGMKNGKIVKVGNYIEIPEQVVEGVGREGPRNRYKAGKYIIPAKDSFGSDAYASNVKSGGKGNIFYNNMKVLQKSRKAPLTGLNSKYQTTTRITDSVALYLPPGIGNTTSATYGDFATGVAGYLALSGIDIIESAKNRDFAAIGEKLFESVEMLATEAVKKFSIAAVETFTGSEGIQQTFDKAFGQTLNPYMEVAYNAMGMRTFDYTFKFAPKSEKESQEVKDIIQLFRFHMAPEMKQDLHRYLTLPSTFDIHYMFQSGMGDTAKAEENSFYNKIATCVLTSCDVNYTPNEEVQSFKHGAPTQIAMTLAFKETEMLTKQKIEQGF